MPLLKIHMITHFTNDGGKYITHYIHHAWCTYYHGYISKSGYPLVWWVNNMHKEKGGLPNDGGALNWFGEFWIYC